MCFFLHCRKCCWYHKLCSCWQVLTQVYLQNIWLLKYSHIKDAPFAQKTGGVWWGGQAEPKADGGWDALGGQRAVRLDPLGWKSGTAKGQSRLVTAWRGKGESVSALLLFLSSMSPHLGYWTLGRHSSLHPSSWSSFSITRSVHPPYGKPKNKLPWPHFSPWLASQSQLESAVLLGLPSLLHPFDHATTFLPKLELQGPHKRNSLDDLISGEKERGKSIKYCRFRDQERSLIRVGIKVRRGLGSNMSQKGDQDYRPLELEGTSEMSQARISWSMGCEPLAYTKWPWEVHGYSTS